jgi:hypothetical protein
MDTVLYIIALIIFAMGFWVLLTELSMLKIFVRVNLVPRYRRREVNPYAIVRGVLMMAFGLIMLLLL